MTVFNKKERYLMNTYVLVKINDKYVWKVFIDENSSYRDLKWYEWINLRLIQLRDWFHLLGKEK